ncbi:apolipoprotein N-acyltransferase [Myxococcota bacterium]|nr:apolipoprotein N-acyltransferase [Myxococcota bacterium]
MVSATRGGRITLAICAGLLNGIAFIFHGELALIANVPLLLALRDSQSAMERALLGGLVGFLGGLHIYGILNYGALLFWAFSTYTASQMILYGLLIHIAWRKHGAWIDLLLPALIWTFTEWVRSVGPLAMPASYVGCVADVAWLRPLLALAPLTGGLGVSTIIALSQGALYLVLFERGERRRVGVVGLAVVLLVYAGGAVRHHVQDQALKQPLRVSAVQGGLANAQYAAAEGDPAAMRDVVATYEALTRRAHEAGAGLIIWPETAVRAPVLRAEDLRRRLLPRAEDQATLIAGLIVEDAEGYHRNGAVALGPGGVELDRYYKVRLVPGTEAHFKAGAAFTPLETPVGKIGALICLESVYPSAARAITAAGATLLVVMSNDAGFGRSPITRHMTNRAIVRAVENGRWLVRVGQAGISALIAPTGEVKAALGLFEAAVLTGEVDRITALTPYTRFGDWWMALCGLALLGILAVSGQRGLRRP